MKILEKSEDFTAKQVYEMTQDKNVISVKDVPTNSIIHATGYVMFEDTDTDGNATEILSIRGCDENGEVVVWACQSKTFKRSFKEIVDINTDAGTHISDGIDIQKLDGESKSGRPYVDCRWA